MTDTNRSRAWSLIKMIKIIVKLVKFQFTFFEFIIFTLFLLNYAVVNVLKHSTITGDFSKGVHLFPYRTQQLRPLAPKILAWRRAGKIGHCRYSKNEKCIITSLFFVFIYILYVFWNIYDWIILSFSKYIINYITVLIKFKWYILFLSF